ncbi:30S ribosomal protein S9 [Candidatus Giovannonibacteria bacterium]|nr:30S ribosomal protein S9 [Candidatus Giovannonibacteria bacterium]
MAKTDKKTIEKKPAASPSKYFEAVGRRKTSIARTRLLKDAEGILINEKPLKEYFKTAELQNIVESPLKVASLEKIYGVSARLKGGGIHSQAEALRHGISRAILKIDSEQRKPLKVRGYLKRDPRAKERRKFGLKKARKAPQWAKR